MSLTNKLLLTSTTLKVDVENGIGLSDKVVVVSEEGYMEVRQEGMISTMGIRYFSEQRAGRGGQQHNRSYAYVDLQRDVSMISCKNMTSSKENSRKHRYKEEGKRC